MSSMFVEPMLDSSSPSNTSTGTSESVSERPSWRRLPMTTSSSTPLASASWAWAAGARMIGGADRRTNKK